MRKYYIEFTYTHNKENYIMQSRWFDNEQDAIEWAKNVAWLHENYDAYLIATEWNEEKEYEDIVEEMWLDI